MTGTVRRFQLTKLGTFYRVVTFENESMRNKTGIQNYAIGDIQKRIRMNTSRKMFRFLNTGC